MERRDLRIPLITRERIRVSNAIFPTDESLDLLYREASLLAYRYNNELKAKGAESGFVSPGKLHASAVLHLIYQIVLTARMSDGQNDFFTRRIAVVASNEQLSDALGFFSKTFPSPALEDRKPDAATRMAEDMRGWFIHQVLMQNPALLSASKPFVSPDEIVYPPECKALSSILSSFVKDDLRNGKPNTDDIFTMLQLPARLYPDSLEEQIKYILREWSMFLPDELIKLLQVSLDFIHEEEKDRSGVGGGGGPTEVIDYSESELNEYEAFSDDSNWMPRLVMMAKCTLVWLDQLSKQYKRSITRLDQIPDEELDKLQARGFTALWLIGLWERSEASKKIKNLCGNPDAEASAYSLKDYEISSAIGGWGALENLRDRCRKRGIRLASDMVPNHTGIDGNWVYEHPDYFIQQDWPPFPSYTYNGPDLSTNPDYEVKIEDHYYDRTDAAVTFRLVDKRNGRTRYIFHGNDGTSMPWNDTAQLDYLNPVTREAVIQKIIHVAKNFPIIRFDAAMTLAKRHIQRLWYPKPGHGGDIAGRASHAISDEEFNRRIPQEFWREVVDRIAVEVPDTLLLAEAFWMMEGYFVRTLGMHRVYNSAFMNMLKNQENQKYRLGIKNTLVFEPEILKRYVNFMNNPDEETAIAQFGDGDKYFAVCTLLATLPGLPMVGHGQIEGYHEKYGMEYRRAYYNEQPNEWLVGEHCRRIFPLFRRRYLFSGVEYFQLYDCYNQNGGVEESVYAFVNGTDKERTLVLVNNQYERTGGTINTSVPKLRKDKDNRTAVTMKLAENLGLSFSGSAYALFDCFTDGLTYIIPSIQLYEEGYSFGLNGYEARVYWNIREVDDTDGSYEKLWRMYGRKGIRNISKAVALLRLEPLYKAMEALRSQETLKNIRDLVNGRLSKQAERELLLSIAESYAAIPEVYKTLDEPAKGQIGVVPTDVEPKPAIRLVRTLASVFREKKGKVFPSWAGADDSLPLIIASALVLYPFSRKLSIREAMEEADRLLIDAFFEYEFGESGYNDNERRSVIHSAAVALAAWECYAKDMSPEELLSAVLSDEGVQNLAKCNEYQGEIWYNKEQMQSIILLTALSFTTSQKIKDFDADSFVSRLFEREAQSGYKLKNLLRKEQTEEKE